MGISVLKRSQLGTCQTRLLGQKGEEYVNWEKEKGHQTNCGVVLPIHPIIPWSTHRFCCRICNTIVEVQSIKAPDLFCFISVHFQKFMIEFYFIFLTKERWMVEEYDQGIKNLCTTRKEQVKICNFRGIPNFTTM